MNPKMRLGHEDALPGPAGLPPRVRWLDSAQPARTGPCAHPTDGAARAGLESFSGPRAEQRF
jgi:hypothetical protein